jgi:uncharacterized GH25 family protein
MHSLPRLTAALVLSGAAAAGAHDTWLRSAPRQAPGATAVFALTSSGSFPEPDHAIEPGRVERSLCRVAGQEVPLRAGSRSRQALRLRARGLAAGVAACGVSLKPRTLELKAEDVAHYLEEVGAQDTIGAAWKARGAGAAWRETYAKHAKACTRVGDRGDGSWREPLGLDFELVPLSDPTGLTPGATLEVRLLKAGQPLRGLAVRASRAGQAPVFATTGEDGRASFTLGAAGPWLLAATEIRPHPARPSEWESDFTTLVVEVAP